MEVEIKSITASEAKEWLARNNVALSHEITGGHGRSACYVLPKDSGVKTALARSIGELYGDTAEVLIELDNWDVWPSSCSMFVFDMFRKASGDERSIEAAPAQVVTRGEGPWVEGLVALVLYFVWDAYVADSEGEILIFISHDEWLRVWAKDRAAQEQIERHLAFMALEPCGR